MWCDMMFDVMVLVVSCGMIFDVVVWYGAVRCGNSDGVVIFSRVNNACLFFYFFLEFGV